MQFFKGTGKKATRAVRAFSLIVLRVLRRNLRIIYLAGRKFGKDYCVVRAAALAFATSLALVPAAITFLIVAKWSGLLELSRISDWVRNFLIKRFLPTEGAENAIVWLGRFGVRRMAHMVVMAHGT